MPTSTPRADSPSALHRWFVVSLLCLSFALRLFNVQDHPPFVHGDGANLAEYSLRVARGEEPWYGVRVDGDTNFAFLQFAPYALLGTDLLAVRYMAVWWGMLSLAGAYYGTRRLFGNRVAAFALCLMATGHLLIHFGRAASIVMPSLLSGFLAVGLLLRAQGERGSRRARAWAFALAGAVAALNLYEYAAAKAVFFGLAALLLLSLPFRRAGWRAWFEGTAWFSASAALVASPILLWYVQHPVQATGRFTELNVFNPRYAALNMKLYGTGDSQTLLVRQTLRSLGGFFITDDTSPNYRIQAPLMDMATAILALTGIVVAARRHWRRTLALLIWLVAGLIAGAILLIEPPTSYHYIVLVPIAMVFAAVALDWMFSRWVGRPWVPIMIAGIALLNANWYFVEYPTRGAWHSAESSIGRFARRRARCCHFVHLGYPDVTPRRISALAAAPEAIEYVSNLDSLYSRMPLIASDRRPVVVFVPASQQVLIARLQQQYPRSRSAPYVERGYTLFWTLTVDDLSTDTGGRSPLSFTQ